MKKAVNKMGIFISVVLICGILVGFSTEWDKRYLLISEAKTEIMSDENGYLEKLESNLGLSSTLDSVEREQVLSSGGFVKKDVTSQGKLDENLNYKVSASVVIWESDNYFAICEVENPTFTIYDDKNNAVKNDTVWADVKNGTYIPSTSDSAIELVFGCYFQQDPNDEYSYATCRVSTFVPKENKVYISQK